MKLKFWYVLIYVVFFSMAIAAFVGGIVILYKNFDLKYNGVFTQGIVTAWKTSHTSMHDRTSASLHTSDGSHNFPVISYEANKTKIITATRSSADDDGITIGDKVQIVYRRSEPDYVELQSHISESFISGGVCLFIGILFTSIIGFIGFRIWKDRNSSEDIINQLT
jgi:hypothetical protein